jgi:pyruvate formate lyase activating enzyme
MNNLKLYKNTKNGIQCLLCPHLCTLENGETGKCRVRKNNGEKIELLTYGLISSMAVEPIEKKPIKKYINNHKCLSVGSLGCNLHCVFCENFKISQSKDTDNTQSFPPANIIFIAKEKKCESVCMTYNEPTIAYEFLIDIANECHNNNLKFVLKTNGYVCKEPWEEICKNTDIMNIDYKGSESTFKEFTSCESYITKERITEAHRAPDTHLEISVPLYYRDDILEEEIEELGQFLSSIDVNIPVHLLRISASYKYYDFIFNDDNMEKSKDILSKYMNNIYCS